MPDSQPGEANRIRIDRLERDVDHIQNRLEDYGALKQTVANLDRAVASLAEEFSGLRRALAVASITVAGSAVLFAVSVVVATIR